jgi:phosphoribosyl 1,2-cyclic phosphate phosphodiesterase
MSGELEITILGSGSSGGVPRADGDWGDCDPANPRNRRTRCAMLVRRLSGEGPEARTTVLVDTSPDMRLQTAEAGARRLDAVLLTHDHADQTHGIDDIRAFALRQGHTIPTYMDAATEASMLARFDYVFHGQGGYSPICQALRLPPLGRAFEIDGPSGVVPVTTFDQDHGGVRSVGYRFGGVAYSSDVVDLPPDAYEALAGLDVWIVDALRYRPHPTHAHVAKTLGWIEKVRPKRAILTNLHVDLDYAVLAAELPEGVEPAYDGLRFTAPLD